MATQTSSDTPRSGLSLSSVRVLESPEDWLLWDQEIRDFLIIGGFNDILTRNPDQAPARNPGVTLAAYAVVVDAWNDKQDRAKAAVRNRCGYKARTLIQGATTVAQAFAILEPNFKRQGSGIFTELCKRFYELTLSDCKDVSEYTEKFRKVRNELISLHTTLALPEPFVVQKFLHGLGPAYNIFQSTFNQTHNILPVTPIAGEPALIPVTFNVTSLAALNEERRLANQDNTPSTAHGFLATPKGPGNEATITVKHCTKCNKNYHTVDECWEAHPHLKKAKKAAQQSKKRKGADADAKDAEPTTPLSFIAVNATSLDLPGVCIVDTGCSQHVTCQRNAFTSYEMFSGGSPVGGIGGVELNAAGQGTVQLQCNTNGSLRVVTLSNVFHCPKIGVNLISVSQLLKRKAQVSFTEMACKIQLGEGANYCTGVEKDGLFTLDLWPEVSPTKALAAYSLSNPLLGLWHERMGHLGEQNLRKLEKMATGIDLSQPLPITCTCEPCVMGRMKEAPHRSPIVPGTAPLDLIYMDVCGPFSVTGARGERYWASYIDSYTQVSEAKPIKHKSEAFTGFKEFLQANERPDRKCHRIRVDQGGEYSSKEMQQWCVDRGIIIEASTTEQHQQNGGAEVFNRITMDKLHSTLLSAEISKKWWPEILRATNYLRNRSPSSTIGKTPYEAWYFEKPDLSHVRTIGSTAYALKAQPKRRKLVDVKAIKCLLVGYEGTKIYRLLTPDGAILRSSNVHFQEKRPAVSTEEVGAAAKTLAVTKRRASDDIVNAPKRQLRSADSVGAMSQATGERQGRKLLAIAPPNSTRIETNGTLIDSARIKTSGTNAIVGRPDTNSGVTGTRSNAAANTTPTMVTRSATERNKFLAFLAQASSPEPSEPKSYAEALADRHWKMWEQGMIVESQSLEKNHTWTLVARPQDRKVLRGKWVYKLKRGLQGEVLRYKSRWVVRGFEQKEGLDFNETFATVVKPMSYKALFAIAAALDLEIEQMDVVTAFLYGHITEEIYVEQLTGLEDGSNKVCRVNKALYGLRQSPRIWFTTLSMFLQELGFTPLAADLSVFELSGVFIAIYVDDLLLVGSQIAEIQAIKQKLNQKFHMTDLGACSHYLGMSITRDRSNHTIYISQGVYVEKVLRDFGMWDAKVVATPMDANKLDKSPEGFEAAQESRVAYQSAVGSLMYAMLGTRADIAYAVSVVSRYASNPDDSHWKAVKRIFRYLRGTVGIRLVFRGPLAALTGYTDADWAGDYGTRRSTSGYVFNLGSGAISWSSKRQPTVALSTCEAEYIGQTQATKEAIWLRGLLDQFGVESSEGCATIIFCDNLGAMALAKNPEFHSRTKHLDIQHHFIREKIREGRVQLEWITTEEQLADGLTKPLSKERFLQFRSLLGLEDSN